MAPLGVYDHPPDPDVPGVDSVQIGTSIPSKAAYEYTRALDTITDLIDLLPGP